MTNNNHDLEEKQRRIIDEQKHIIEDVKFELQKEHSEIEILKEIARPPSLAKYKNEKYDEVLCEPGYFVTGFSVDSESLDDFLFSNRFIYLFITCSNNKIQILQNKALRIRDNFRFSFDSNFVIETEKQSFIKPELKCEEDEKMIGIVFTRETHRLEPYCSKQKIVFDGNYYSPVFGSFDGAYGEINEIVCSSGKFITNVKINTNKWKYIENIDIYCQKISYENMDYIFDFVEVSRGDWIDRVIYKKESYTSACDGCSNGGKIETFKCPKNYSISGHNLWKYKNGLLGIRFICSPHEIKIN